MKQRYLFKTAVLSVVMMLLGMGTYAQVTVGTGTSTQRFPFAYWYGYGRTASIYTADELNVTTTGGSITSLSWYSDIASTVTGPTIIYLKTVGTTTAVASDTWANTIAGATTVWSGNPPAFTVGWNQLTLNAPFPVAAGQNVEVLVETNYGGGGGGGQFGTAFRYTSAGTNNNAWWQSDTNPPTGTPTQSTSGAINNQRPNIIFGGLTPPSCVVPASITTGTYTTTGATLTWTAPTTGTPQGYQWEVRASGTPGTAGAAASGSTNASTFTANATGLAAGTTYTAYVRTFCGGTDYSAWIASNTFVTLYNPPPNDECANAVTLTVNTGLTCTATTSGTISGATASAGPTAGCGTFDDDVWFKFVAGSTSHRIALTSVSGSITDYSYQVLDACGAGATELLCTDPETATVSGLTPGSTYYIRVASYTSTAAVTGNFTLCVSTLPAPPVNDECVNARTLVHGFPGASLLDSTAGGTQSQAAGACSGTPDDDIWFKFVATATSATITISGTTAIGTGTSPTDMYHQLLDGSCGTLTSLKCSDADVSTTTGLTIGNTYYIRAYTYYSGDYAKFNIKVEAPAPPPSNDDAAGAIALTVNPDYNCGSVVSGTTAGATQSTDPAPSCSAAGRNDDVWYVFTATNTTHRIVLYDITAGTLAVALYTGTPGSLTAVSGACFSGSTVGGPAPLTDFTGLTVGTTYYARVYTTTSTATTRTPFTICIGTGTGAAPANDECVNAVDISNTVAVNGSNSGATQSEAPCDATATYAANDAWYKFVTPTAGSVTVNVTTTFFDAVMAVYEGSCASHTILTNGCQDSPSLGTETLTFTSTAGTTYYVRVFGYNDQRGTFSIQATGQPLAIRLGELTAANEGSRNRIQWTSMEEMPGDSYVVERSADGKNFVALATIEGKGKASTYTYWDNSPINGANYYRLKLVNIDANAAYSNTVKVMVKNTGAIVVEAYPNPVSNMLTVKAHGELSANATVQVTDVTGKVVRTVELDGNTSEVNMNGLAAGMYLVKFTDGTHTQTIRVTKQ